LKVIIENKLNPNENPYTFKLIEVVCMEINKTSIMAVLKDSYNKKQIAEKKVEMSDKVELSGKSDKNEEVIFTLNKIAGKKESSSLNLLSDIRSGSPDEIDPNIIEATDDNFDEILKKSEYPVMVDFYNPG
jgi:hypothetical protein